jgi:hypothetical protein
MGEMRNRYKILIGKKLKGNEHAENIATDGR